MPINWCLLTNLEVMRGLEIDYMATPDLAYELKSRNGFNLELERRAFQHILSIDTLLQLHSKVPIRKRYSKILSKTTLFLVIIHTLLLDQFLLLITCRSM